MDAKIITKEMVDSAMNGDRIDGYVLIQSIETKNTTTGSPYLSGNLQCQGRVPFKVWSNNACFQGMRADADSLIGSVCRVMAKVNVYEGTTSLIIDGCSRAAEGTEGVPDVTEFLTSKYEPDKAFNSLRSTIVKNCSEEAVKVFDLIMAEYGEAFKKEFAAIGHHDACLGGLLGHSLKGAKILSIMQFYPDLLERCGGKDVLLVGYAIHDIGKILEYHTGAITKAGSKLSHMVMGAVMLSKFEEEITTLCGEDYYLQLMSIVSEHAGEWGDRPRTVAAYVCHMIDNLEAHLTSLDEIATQPQIYYEGFRLN